MRTTGLGGCGCLTIIIAVIFLMLLVVVPSIMDLEDAAPLQTVMQQVFCQNGEVLTNKRYSSPAYDGGTNYSSDFFCVNAERQQRDVTGIITISGMMGFSALLTVGILMSIGAGMFASRKSTQAILPAIQNMAAQARVQRVYNVAGASSDTDIQSFLSNFGQGGAQALGLEGQESLKDKLKQLQESYDLGLIDKEEYDDARKRLLEKL